MCPESAFCRARRDKDAVMDTDMSTTGGAAGRRGAESERERERERATSEITDREVAILRALVKQGSLAKAAVEVNLSERHTRRVVEKLRLKLGLQNSYSLVAWASAAGLLETSDLRHSKSLRPVEYAEQDVQGTG